MDRLRQLACLLLVALWLPATLHCGFEAIGLDELFHCETDHHAAPDAGCADACAVVENGWIKRASSELALAAPTLCVSLTCLANEALPPLLDERNPPPLPRDAAPPELARTWQFTTRAAPPSRAPAQAS